MAFTFKGFNGNKLGEFPHGVFGYFEGTVVN